MNAKKHSTFRLSQESLNRLGALTVILGSDVAPVGRANVIEYLINQEFDKHKAKPIINKEDCNHEST